MSSSFGSVAAAARRDAVNPAWFHDTLTLKIGQGEYTFRTLSLYDVWELWPHLVELQKMTLAGRPLSAVEHAIAVLAYLAPSLVAHDEDCKAVTQDHANLLLDFYRHQDWERMATLGRQTTNTTEAAEGAPAGMKPHDVFVAVCMAGAKNASMPVTDFVQQRFEFCADHIIVAYRSMGGGGADEAPAQTWKTFWAKAFDTLGPPKKASAPPKGPE